MAAMIPQHRRRHFCRDGLRTVPPAGALLYDSALESDVVHLTPREVDKLLIFSAGELARKRRARGLKLNHPEAVALITDEILEGARDGKSVADLMSSGSTILSTEDVMPGIAAMVPILQVEGVFPDGTKLVTIHQPIRPKPGAPVDPLEVGALVPADGELELSAGRPRLR